MDAAAKVGFTYMGVDEKEQHKKNEEYEIHLVRVNPGLLKGKSSQNAEIRRFRADAMLEFDSVRKRMSVMVRDEDGKCFIFSKGAEVTMLDRRVSLITHFLAINFSPTLMRAI